MSLERIVQIHIAALATIGAVLLGMGQDSPLLAMLAVFAAVTSIIFTDSFRWFHLNRWLANALALVALFFCLSDFLEANTRGQLLAIANLLVYLQIILFYQRKSDRLYWQLAILSLLQIVVSAALNVGIEFGVGLILYAAVAFSTLSFFFVHREVTRCARSTDPSVMGRERSRLRTDQPATKPWSGLLQRTPIARQLSTANEVGRRVVGMGLLRQTAAIGLMTLAFAFVLFFSAPRLDSSGRRGFSSRITRVVGFSQEVTLDEMGEILESSEPVMRVSFSDPETRAPYRIYGEPYFRGAVLVDYVSHRGDAARWIRLNLPRSLRGVISERVRLLPAPPPDKALVRQDVLLEPINEPILFSIPSSYGLPLNPADIYVNPITANLSARSQYDERALSQIRYSIATTGILGGLQIDVTPHRIRSTTPEDLALLAWERHRLLRYDKTQFPILKRIADEIGDEQRANKAKRSTLAKALRNHFLTSERYTYSLDFRNPNRNRAIDPIEDFVANHGTGHCEYFASALVIMLRSQKIPARLVTGFRGGEYNALGGYYQVTQSDAHAWVEAYLEPEDVAKEAPPNSDLSPAGGWLRLDPTPGSDIDTARQMETGPMDIVDDVLDYARTLWSDYVLGLTAQRQRERIYTPVSETTNLEDWSALFKQLRDDVGTVLTRFRRIFTSWLGWAVILGIAALLAVVYVTRRHWRRIRNSRAVRVVRRWRSRVTRRFAAGNPSPQAMPVQFYRRLEDLLGQLGMSRRPSVTPREFALRAAGQLNNSAFSTAIRGVPKRIVDALYRVRFGRVDLPREEVEAIDNSLSDLEQAIAVQIAANGRPEQAASRTE
jgi:transglutaminase-like putative cysteine protease